MLSRAGASPDRSRKDCSSCFTAKPTVIQDCAERMGFELRYASMPNRDTHRSLLEFTEFLRHGLAALEPQDNIDLQSFMYVIATDGYVRDVLAEREPDADRRG